MDYYFFFSRSASFGLLWIVVDYFFGRCGSSWLVMGHCRLLWVTVDYFLGDVGILLNVLCQNASFWNVFLGRCGLF